MPNGNGKRSDRVFVIGVGMTKFEKPGSKEWDYPDMAREAGTNALQDAGITYDQVEQAAVGYVYGDSCAGERALYELGTTGIPIYNVNNNCSTGSTALFLGASLIRGGAADCTLALGFEKMQPGSLSATFTDREPPVAKHYAALFEIYEPVASPPAAQMFGIAGREHMDKYGSKPEHFAWIGYKNHKHSVNNPYSQFQDEYTLEEVQNARVIYEPLPLTLLQCSPTSDGSGAAVLASERFVEEHGLWDRAIEIVGQSMVTDMASSFEDKSAISAVGAKMTSRAAQEVYEQAQTGPDEVDVVELHDCFSANELITYEGLGLAEEGTAHELVEREATTFGGDGPVVNPSGGLISKGHPLGATGLAQCSELVWQLRGDADARQVDDARVGLQHNIGIGGAVVVTMYKPAAEAA
jgi:acetyl-CoA acetyltransferase